MMINNTTHKLNSKSDLIKVFEEYSTTEYREIWIRGHGEADLYILFNKKYAMLNYFEYGLMSGDGGVTSVNPNPPSTDEDEQEFRHENGQFTFQPLKYLVSHQAALSSLIAYFETGKKDPQINWE